MCYFKSYIVILYIPYLLVEYSSLHYFFPSFYSPFYVLPISIPVLHTLAILKNAANNALLSPYFLSLHHSVHLSMGSKNRRLYLFFVISILHLSLSLLLSLRTPRNLLFRAPPAFSKDPLPL